MTDIDINTNYRCRYYMNVVLCSSMTWLSFSLYSFMCVFSLFQHSNLRKSLYLLIIIVEDLMFDLLLRFTAPFSVFSSDFITPSDLIILLQHPSSASFFNFLLQHPSSTSLFHICPAHSADLSYVNTVLYSSLIHSFIQSLSPRYLSIH